MLTTIIIQTLALRNFLETNFSRMSVNYTLLRTSFSTDMKDNLFSRSCAIVDLCAFFISFSLEKLLSPVASVIIKHK